ncbi:recombinase family protein [Vibrio jasicida]|uniref:recombinase family protein n=1 Tax=Vibrio jasicida TaxID=766224 RepID=UPI000A490ED7|nr:recombinase family protein [Vibrio jasicida]
MLIKRNISLGKKEMLNQHLLEVVDYIEQKDVPLVVLNLGIDTKSPTGRLTLTMIEAVASFERQLLLERQAEGIAIAKSKGKYKGRKPIPNTKRSEVESLLKNGIKKTEIAETVKVSLSTVYRVAESLVKVKS